MRAWARPRLRASSPAGPKHASAPAPAPKPLGVVGGGAAQFGGSVYRRGGAPTHGGIGGGAGGVTVSATGVRGFGAGAAAATGCVTSFRPKSTEAISGGAGGGGG